MVYSGSYGVSHLTIRCIVWKKWHSRKWEGSWPIFPKILFGDKFVNFHPNHFRLKTLSTSSMCTTICTSGLFSWRLWTKINDLSFANFAKCCSPEQQRPVALNLHYLAKFHFAKYVGQSCLLVCLFVSLSSTGRNFAPIVLKFLPHIRWRTGSSQPELRQLCSRNDVMTSQNVKNVKS